MPKPKITPEYIANHIRRVLKDGGSAPHSTEVQHYFKEEIQSRGWRTAELRKVAVRFRRSIAREQGMEFVVQVADQLFSGRMLEEKVFAVFLLENQTGDFGQREFPVEQHRRQRFADRRHLIPPRHRLIGDQIRKRLRHRPRMRRVSSSTRAGQT